MKTETRILEFTLSDRKMKIPLLELEEVDSTNDYLKRFVEEGNKGNRVVRADYQINGRGRFDRKWESPRGENLLFSVLLHPRVAPSKTSILTILTAQALIRTLRRLTVLDFEIKKPNDVLCGGKKIAGILTEQETFENQVKYVLVGVGVNVNRVPDKKLLPGAASLAELAGRRFDLSKVFLEIMRDFFEEIREFI